MQCMAPAHKQNRSKLRLVVVFVGLCEEWQAAHRHEFQTGFYLI